MESEKKLVIVSGASGSLGRAYIENLRERLNVECVGIVRSGAKSSEYNTRVIHVDLLDESEVVSSMNGIDFTHASEVIFIHPVGKFKFEKNGKPDSDVDHDGIDDDVYRSNVDTFRAIVHPLLKKLHQQALLSNPIPLKLCAFGSISDRYHVPYWQSYSKSKDILRQLMFSLVKQAPVGSISGMVVNLSSVDTHNERDLRPSADKAYWLSCHEIAEKTVPVLLDEPFSWKEFDVFKPKPAFDPSYYRDHQRILKKWIQEIKPRSFGKELSRGRRR
jgi:NADP-dependent 3-hydroxy acid dehydrogenase YdfG